jgi:hypothetical protein
MFLSFLVNKVGALECACPKDSFYSKGTFKHQKHLSLNSCLFSASVSLEIPTVTALNQIYTLVDSHISLTLGKIKCCFSDRVKILTKGAFSADRTGGTGPTAGCRWIQSSVQT